MELNEYAKMDALEKDHWWFVAKRQFLAVLIHKYAGQGGRLLDIGCGTGAVLDFFSTQGGKTKGFQVEGIDMSPAALEYCHKKGLKVALGKAEVLVYADNTFDVIIASDVLEHIEDTDSVLREISRVLKPGGIFVVTVPAHQFLFSQHDVALHHVRRYSKNILATSLQKHFTIQWLGWIHAIILIPAIIARLGRRFLPSKKDSDVGEPNRLINALMKKAYSIEFFWFNYAKLPWGLSLAAIVKKSSV